MRLLTSLIWILFLTLGACAKVVGKSDNFTRSSLYQKSSGRTGFGNCSGTLGGFDVLVLRTETKDIFELAILPQQTTTSTATVQIHVVNTVPEFKEVNHAVFFNQAGKGHVVGKLTSAELARYNVLAITPTDDTGTPYLNQAPTKDAICNLPIPE